jgi:ElaB/YqjD/DUF883 family membrane-anchored ribosome-binding protein
MEHVDTNNLAKQGQALTDKATPFLSRVAGQAQAFGQQGVDAVSDYAQQARKTASQASDSIVTYTQENPVKALLIAAASGALLFTLIKAIAPSRD